MVVYLCVSLCELCVCIYGKVEWKKKKKNQKRKLFLFRYSSVPFCDLHAVFFSIVVKTHIKTNTHENSRPNLRRLHERIRETNTQKHTEEALKMYIYFITITYRIVSYRIPFEREEILNNNRIFSMKIWISLLSLDSTNFKIDDGCYFWLRNP